MPSLTVSASSRWPASHEHSGQSLTNAHGMPTPEVGLTWAPNYVFYYTYQHAFQDAQLYWPCVRHCPPNPFSFQPQGQTQPSFYFVVSTACPQCRQHPKLPDHRFCSVACGQSAARFAPELKYLAPYHELFMKVGTQFINCWRSEPLPKVLAIYMITWTESYQKSFEQYRDIVEARGQFKRVGLSSGNEQKRFRSTSRACTLGERGNLSPCHNEVCLICETIRYGFEPHLRRKRSIPLNGGSIRLGAGIYTSHTSSKADQYAMNAYDPSSNVKAMLICRVVIGNPYVMYQEDQRIRSPPRGYDCIFGKPGFQSAFEDDEYVVYDADAIRAAYLVLYETVQGA